MAGWHSLSGYLSYRSGGALGRLKSKKRQWFIFEEAECQLLSYNSEEDSLCKSPQNVISVGSASISLNLEEQNQFIIRCDGKEHIFTAENHESMMIWLLGLQAKRDAFMSKLLPKAADKIDEMPFLRRKKSEAELSLLHASLGRASSDPKSHRGSTGTDRKVSDAGVAYTKSIGSDKEEYCEMPPGRRSVDYNSPKKTIWRKGSADSASNMGYHNNTSTDHDSDGVFRNNNIISSKTLSSEEKGQILLVRKRSTDLTANDKMSSGVDSTERSRNFFSNPFSDFFSGLRLPNKSDADIDSDSGGWYLAGGGSEGCDGVASCAVPRSSASPLFSKSSSPQSSSSSLSGQSASGDSAIDHDLSNRITDMEKELMSTKCELANLKNRESQYKDMILEREGVIVDLSEAIERLEDKKAERRDSAPNTGVLTSTDKKTQEKVRVMQNQNRFLNEEVRRMANLRQQEAEKFHDQENHIRFLESEVEKWKRDYVYLLQSNISIPSVDSHEGMEVNLHGGNRHKERIQELLEQARKVNPGLPTYDRLAKCGVHVDCYGFKHTYNDEGLLLHYICLQLNHHYTSQLATHEQHQIHWKEYLRNNKNNLQKTKELKLLCRNGIPPQHRNDVWSKLVQNRVQDIIKDKGPHYYSNLCNLIPESQFAGRYRKQISLDLLRTMPSNVHFSSLCSDGILRMRDILQAYCIHNPNVGYCQGMNFIVGMSLLFLDAGNAFWLLVAITEKYFTSNYFDQNLIGAQADQEVLKELCKEKLPKLYRHLEEIDIDLCTVTLNWFLAVFFDSVPFETLLRIWDCFLLEGPKVLFRFALAILKIHESSVLEKHDTISIMRHLKSCAKLTFDVEGLMKTAFEDLEPFPHRQDISVKQAYYVNALKETLRKKELARRAFSEREQMLEELELVPNSSLIIECAALYDEGMLWICQGQQSTARICKVNCDENMVYDLDIEFDSRVVCMCSLNDDVILLGTLGWIIYAYSTRSKEKLWQLCLNDAVLAICQHQSDGLNKVFAALADGTVAILEDIGEEQPNNDIFYIPVGYCPLTAMVIVEQQLWCACGNIVYILHASMNSTSALKNDGKVVDTFKQQDHLLGGITYRGTVTLDPMDSFTISVNPFDHILSMVHGEAGVWIAMKGSSVIELWDHKQLTCKVLYDVKENRFPVLRKEDGSYFNRSRITSILPYKNSIWIGTGEGNLIIYDVGERSKKYNMECTSSADISHSSSPYLTSRGEMVNLTAVEEKVNELYFQRLQDKVGKRSGQACRETESLMGSFRLSLSDVRSVSTETITEIKCTNCDVNAETPQILSPASKQSWQIGDQQIMEGNIGSECVCNGTNELYNNNKYVCNNREVNGVGEQDAGNDGSAVNNNTVGDQTQCDCSRNIETDSDVMKDSANTVTKDSNGSTTFVDCDNGELNVGDTSKTNAIVCPSENKFNDTETVTTNGACPSCACKGAPECNDLCRNYVSMEMNKQLSKVCSETTDSTNGHGDPVTTETSQNMSDIRNSQGLTIVIESSSPLMSRKYNNVDSTDVKGNECSDHHDGSQSGEGPGNCAVCDKGNPTPGGATLCISHSDNSDLTDTLTDTLTAESMDTGTEYTLKEMASHDVTCMQNGEIDEANGIIANNGNEMKTVQSNPSFKTGSRGQMCSEEKPIESIPSMESLGSVPSTESFRLSPNKGNELTVPLSADYQTSSLAWSDCEALSSSQRESSNDSDGVIAQSSSKMLLRESSTASMGSVYSTNDVLYSHELHLQAKVKITDKPIRCLVLTSCKNEPIIISCAGCYGDDEAILKWKREPNEKIWTNEPVYEICPETNQPKPPSYMRQRFSSSSSIRSGESLDSEKSERSSFSILPKFGSQNSRSDDDSKLSFSLFN